MHNVFQITSIILFSFSNINSFNRKNHIRLIMIICKQVLWAFPLPQIVDTTSYRCYICKHSDTGHIKEKTQRISPDIQDIRNATGCMTFHFQEIGRVLVTIDFLIHFFAILYETLNFREARRRLIEVTRSNNNKISQHDM